MSLTAEQKGPPDIITDRILISGYAVGVGGFVTRANGKDTSYLLPVQGASALPIIGGYSHSLVDGRTNKDQAPFVSFAKIETEAQGEADVHRPKDKAIVKTRAVVTGLSVVGRFNADYVQASLQLTHQGANSEPTISMDGTSFGSIVLDDEIIRVRIDQELATKTTQNLLLEDVKRNGAKYKHRFLHGAKQDAQVPRLSGSQYIMISIVDNITVVPRDPKKKPKAQVNGHVVTLEGFGAIYFGEMMIRAESRRLSMLRFELGCPDQGRLECCAIESQGETCPP